MEAYGSKCGLRHKQQGAFHRQAPRGTMRRPNRHHRAGASCHCRRRRRGVRRSDCEPEEVSPGSLHNRREVFFAPAALFGFFIERGRGGCCFQLQTVLASFGARVRQILLHQVEEKVHGVIARDHAAAESLDERAAGSAVVKNVEGGIAIDPAAFNEGNRFPKRGGLNTGEKIVYELHQSATAIWTHVDDLATHCRKRGARFLKGRRIPADKKYEFTRRGVRLAAGNRCIERNAAPLLCSFSELARPTW